jgi:hypothetical protein
MSKKSKKFPKSTAPKVETPAEKQLSALNLDIWICLEIGFWDLEFSQWDCHASLAMTGKTAS